MAELDEKTWEILQKTKLLNASNKLTLYKLCELSLKRYQINIFKLSMDEHETSVDLKLFN